MAPRAMRTVNVMVESVKVEAVALLLAHLVMQRRIVAGILLKAAAPTARVRNRAVHDAVAPRQKRKNNARSGPCGPENLPSQALLRACGCELVGGHLRTTPNRQGSLAVLRFELPLHPGS